MEMIQYKPMRLDDATAMRSLGIAIPYDGIRSDEYPVCDWARVSCIMERSGVTVYSILMDDDVGMYLSRDETIPGPALEHYSPKYRLHFKFVSMLLTATDHSITHVTVYKPTFRPPLQRTTGV